MNRELRHLSQEAFQGFLDGSLPAGEAEAVREHVASCARCRSELEAWQVLFHELGELGDLAPSDGFAERVMGALPRPEREKLPLAARVSGRLRAWIARPEPATAPGHLSGEVIQDFLDGLLPRPEVAAAETHLHGCRLCRDEVDTWRTLMVRLDDVPRVAPSEGFTERVMAHVRVQNALVAAQPSLQERLGSWLDAVSPRTRRRVAGLAGAAVTPLATLALVAYAVFSHPLVTVGNLLSFLWLEAQDAVAVLATALLGETVESGLLGVAQSVVGGVGAAPGAAALVLAMFSGLTAVAVWVLYRNLIAPTSVDGRYAHVRF
jgi:anti-sigma factor RsiW